MNSCIPRPEGSQLSTGSCLSLSLSKVSSESIIAHHITVVHCIVCSSHIRTGSDFPGKFSQQRVASLFDTFTHLVPTNRLIEL